MNVWNTHLNVLSSSDKENCLNQIQTTRSPLSPKNNTKSNVTNILTKDWIQNVENHSPEKTNLLLKRTQSPQRRSLSPLLKNKISPLLHNIKPKLVFTDSTHENKKIDNTTKSSAQISSAFSTSSETNKEKTKSKWDVYGFDRTEKRASEMNPRTEYHFPLSHKQSTHIHSPILYLCNLNT
jgi:hypothetical protein